MIWQHHGDVLSVLNPLLVICHGLLEILLLLLQGAIEASSHLSGLGFVKSILIYDIGNGLVYDDLTSAPNMWLH